MKSSFDNVNIKYEKRKQWKSVFDLSESSFDNVIVEIKTGLERKVPGLEREVHKTS